MTSCEGLSSAHANDSRQSCSTLQQLSVTMQIDISISVELPGPAVGSFSSVTRVDTIVAARPSWVNPRRRSQALGRSSTRVLAKLKGDRKGPRGRHARPRRDAHAAAPMKPEVAIRFQELRPHELLRVNSRNSPSQRRPSGTRVSTLRQRTYPPEPA